VNRSGDFSGHGSGYGYWGAASGLRPLILIIMFLAALFWLPTAQADQELHQFVAQLKEGEGAPGLLVRFNSKSADAELLRAWLYENGRYGVAKDPDRARLLFQSAAERGQLDAIAYCYRRCVTNNALIRGQVSRAAAQGGARGLYLASLFEADGVPGAVDLSAADQALVAAGQARSPEAIGRLYVSHFIDWSAGRRSFGEAERKLKRCVVEGVVDCFYLLGLLYDKHHRAGAALLYFRAWQLLAPVRFAQALGDDYLEMLEARLTQGSALLVRARAAVLLVNAPETGFDAIDRFGFCAGQATDGCVSRLSLRDGECLIPAFVHSYFSEFRRSEVYQRCLEGVS
jgi:TPR repeat protein